MIVGANAGSKEAKAEELGIPMLNENQFKILLKTGSVESALKNDITLDSQSEL